MRISDIVKKKEDEEKASKDQESAASDSSVDIWNQGWDDNWKEKLKSDKIQANAADKSTDSLSEKKPDKPDEEDVSIFDFKGKEDKIPESFEEIGSQDFNEPVESKSFLDKIIRPWRQDEESRSISIFAKLKSSVTSTFKVQPRKKDSEDKESGPAIINWLRGKKKKPPSEANQTEEKLITDISSELIPERQPQDIDSDELNEIEDMLAVSMGPEEDEEFKNTTEPDAPEALSQPAQSPEPKKPTTTEPREVAEEQKARPDADASDSSVIGYVEDSDESSPINAPSSQAPQQQENAVDKSMELKKPEDESSAVENESDSVDQSLENVDELVDFIDESRKGQNLMDPDTIFEGDADKERKSLKAKIKRLMQNIRRGIYYALHPSLLLETLGYTWKDAAGAAAIIVMLINILLLLKKHLEN